MKTITEQVSVPVKMVSDDGKFYVTVGKAGLVPTDAEINACSEKVREYEKSAKNVIWARLLEAKVLKPFEAISPHKVDAEALGIKPMDDFVKKYVARSFLDAIYEDGSGISDFYFFLPRTEEDVKDLLTYIDMQGQRTFTDEKKKEKNAFGYNLDDCSISTITLVPGKRYIIAESDDRLWYNAIPLEELEGRIKTLVETLTYFAGK